jgi:hypothetical protein
VVRFLATAANWWCRVMAPPNPTLRSSLARPGETAEATLEEEIVTAREDLREALHRLQRERRMARGKPDATELISDFEVEWERCLVRLRNARAARRTRPLT